MDIREMSTQECLQVLARTKLGRLACASENQPYIVPVYLAYDEASMSLYGYTTPGQKTVWMRANPLVCVEVDEISAYDKWVSVIAMGRYEEFSEPPGSKGDRLRAPERLQRVGENISASFADSRHLQRNFEGLDEREYAWRVLKTEAMWWEPGNAAWTARAHRKSTDPFTSIYYRIRIDRVTGHEATRGALEKTSYAAPALPAGRWDWVRRKLASMFGGKPVEAGSASRSDRHSDP